MSCKGSCYMPHALTLGLVVQQSLPVSISRAAAHPLCTRRYVVTMNLAMFVFGGCVWTISLKARHGLVQIFLSPNHHKFRQIGATPQPQNLDPSTTATSPSSSPPTPNLSTINTTTCECIPTFLQPPRPLGRVRLIWDRGPGGHNQGSLTLSID